MMIICWWMIIGTRMSISMRNWRKRELMMMMRGLEAAAAAYKLGQHLAAIASMGKTRFLCTTWNSFCICFLSKKKSTRAIVIFFVFC